MNVHLCCALIFSPTSPIMFSMVQEVQYYLVSWALSSCGLIGVLLELTTLSHFSMLLMSFSSMFPISIVILVSKKKEKLTDLGLFTVELIPKYFNTECEKKIFGYSQRRVKQPIVYCIIVLFCPYSFGAWDVFRGKAV